MSKDENKLVVLLALMKIISGAIFDFGLKRK